MFEDIKPNFWIPIPNLTPTPTKTKTPTPTKAPAYDKLKELICVKLPVGYDPLFEISLFALNPNGVTFQLSRNGNFYSNNYCYTTPLSPNIYIEVTNNTAELVIANRPLFSSTVQKTIIIRTDYASAGRDSTGRCRVDGIWSNNKGVVGMFVKLGVCSTVVGVTPTPTQTQTPTKTRVFITPTSTPTMTKNPSVSNTPTPTTTGTKTSTPTKTPTATPTKTKTQTPTQTNRSVGYLCFSFPSSGTNANFLYSTLGISPSTKNINFSKSNLLSHLYSYGTPTAYTGKPYYNSPNHSGLFLVEMIKDVSYVLLKAVTVGSFMPTTSITVVARTTQGVTGDYLDPTNTKLLGKLFKQGSCATATSLEFKPTPTPSQNFVLDSASLVSGAANKSIMLQNEDYFTSTQLNFTNGILTNYKILSGNIVLFDYSAPVTTPTNTPTGTPEPTPTETPTTTPQPTTTSTPSRTPEATPTGTPAPTTSRTPSQTPAPLTNQSLTLSQYTTSVKLTADRVYLNIVPTNLFLFNFEFDYGLTYYFTYNPNTGIILSHVVNPLNSVREVNNKQYALYTESMTLSTIFNKQHTIYYASTSV